MAYEKYTVEQFMSACFKKNYKKISKDEFQIVYSEYLDTSGLFMSDFFEKQSYINHLNQRINYVILFLKIQREFISEFKVPFQRDFESFKNQYGHYLVWNNDLEDFEKQLQKVELREEKNKTYLQVQIKELEELRQSKGKDIEKEETEDDLKKSELSFMRMVNSLQKNGFVIDIRKTKMDFFSLMIKQQLEENEQYS